MSMPLTILIVEDEALMAKLLKLSLEKLGYIVCNPAATGEEALGIALADRPNIILMDVNLAGGENGLAVIDKIYEHYRPGIIFITGYSDPALRVKAMHYDPIGFILKPFTPQRIVPYLEKYQREHSGS